MPQELELPKGLKFDLYKAAVFTKIVEDYCEAIHREPFTKREAKGIMAQMMNATHGFRTRIRASLATEEAKRQFDAEWQRDYLAWASIFDSLTQMTDEQIGMVEAFSMGVVKGQIQVEYQESVKCPNCTSEGAKPLGGPNYHCVNCDHYYTVK